MVADRATISDQNDQLQISSLYGTYAVVKQEPIDDDDIRGRPGFDYADHESLSMSRHFHSSSDLDRERQNHHGQRSSIQQSILSTNSRIRNEGMGHGASSSLGSVIGTHSLMQQLMGDNADQIHTEQPPHANQNQFHALTTGQNASVQTRPISFTSLLGMSLTGSTPTTQNETMSQEDLMEDDSEREMREILARHRAEK